MKANHRKISVLLVLCLLVISIAACTKKDNTENDSTGSVKKTTAAKTTAKTTAKAASSTAKASSTADPAQSKTTENKSTDEASNDNRANIVADDTEENDEEAQTDDSVSNVGKNEESYDLKGRTIIFATPNVSYTKEYFRNANTDYNMWTRRMDYVEDRYNCKVEVVPYANTTEYLNTLAANCLAGTYWADIIMVTVDMIMKCHAFMQPLDEWLDLSNMTSGQKYYTYNGKNYCFQNGLAINGNFFILYNRDIISREGVPDPLEL